MQSIVCLTVRPSGLGAATKALLAAFQPFGSLDGGRGARANRLAQLMLRHLGLTNWKRRQASARAIQAFLDRMDDHNPSRFEADGPYPCLVTPTSATRIELSFAEGSRRPEIFVDFGRQPSTSQAIEIFARLEHAGLAYEASTRSEADGLSLEDVPLGEILYALFTRAQEDARWHDRLLETSVDEVDFKEAEHAHRRLRRMEKRLSASYTDFA